jgi:hypothetical protein
MNCNTFHRMSNWQFLKSQAVITQLVINRGFLVKVHAGLIFWMESWLPKSLKKLYPVQKLSSELLLKKRAEKFTQKAQEKICESHPYRIATLLFDGNPMIFSKIPAPFKKSPNRSRNYCFACTSLWRREV